jgi:hypothetical protein
MYDSIYILPFLFNSIEYTRDYSIHLFNLIYYNLFKSNKERLYVNKIKYV